MEEENKIQETSEEVVDVNSSIDEQGNDDVVNEEDETNTSSILNLSGQQLDMLRYRNHKFAYFMCLLAIVANCLGMCFAYSTLNQYQVTFATGIDIIYNIVFMLFTFITAETIKVYSKKASYYAIVLGLAQIGHFFWYSMVLHNAGEMLDWVFFGDMVLFFASGLFLIAAGIVNIFKSTALFNYLKELSETDAAAKLEFEKNYSKKK